MFLAHAGCPFVIGTRHLLLLSFALSPSEEFRLAKTRLLLRFEHSPTCATSPFAYNAGWHRARAGSITREQQDLRITPMASPKTGSLFFRLIRQDDGLSDLLHRLADVHTHFLDLAEGFSLT